MRVTTNQYLQRYFFPILHCRSLSLVLSEHSDWSETVTVVGNFAIINWI